MRDIYHFTDVSMEPAFHITVNTNEETHEKTMGVSVSNGCGGCFDFDMLSLVEAEDILNCILSVDPTIVRKPNTDIGEIFESLTEVFIYGDHNYALTLCEKDEGATYRSLLIFDRNEVEKIKVVFRGAMCEVFNVAFNE